MVELTLSLLLHKSTWAKYPHTTATYAKNDAFSVRAKKRIVETSGIVMKLESSESQNTTSVATNADNVAMFPDPLDDNHFRDSILVPVVKAHVSLTCALPLSYKRIVYFIVVVVMSRFRRRSLCSRDHKVSILHAQSAV